MKYNGSSSHIVFYYKKEVGERNFDSGKKSIVPNTNIDFIRHVS